MSQILAKSSRRDETEMFGKKKEDEFFTMFREYAAAIHEMGELFGTVLKEFDSSEDAIARIEEMESECDTRKHKLLDKLNASFITPFDREDIFAIAAQMDDVADLIEDAAIKLRIYNIQSMQDDAIEMGRILTEATSQIKILFDVLPDQKRLDETKYAIRRVNHFENEGDDVYHRALSRLFREETDAIELVRWKDIYELLDDSLDACEHLADLVKGVITKNA